MSNTNNTGIYPTEDRVLVRPDEVVVKVQGQKVEHIVLPDDVSNKQADAGVLGTIVAVGPRAYDYEDMVGQKVMYARYVGLKTTGLDGKECRLMYAQDIIAVVDPKLEVELS